MARDPNLGGTVRGRARRTGAAAVLLPLLLFSLAACVQKSAPLQDTPPEAPIIEEPDEPVPPIPGIESCPASLTVHAPILIRDDADFADDQSGVVAGQGTPESPYLICGWMIRPGPISGVEIEGTTAHVAIVGNQIHGAIVEAKAYIEPGVDRRIVAGIYVLDAANVRIESNKILDNSPMANVAAPTVPYRGVLIPGVDGVAVEGSTDIQIRGNEIDRNSAAGLRLRESSGLVVESNEIRENHHYGIVTYDVALLTVRSNIVEDHTGASAVLIMRSPAAVLEDNRIANPAANGLSIIDGSDRARVEGNRISGSHRGLAVYESGLVSVQWNDLVDNEEFGLWSDGGETDARNNWWGSAEGPLHADANPVEGTDRFVPWANAPVAQAPA